MFEGGLAAIDKALEETGQKSLNLVSYCVGGTMAGTLMAWLGKHNDKRVASATFFTAQLDFQDAGELQIFVDEHILEVVGEDMDKGYMPADRMANAFNMLRANDLIWGYMVSNYMLGKDPFPFDLLYWNADSTAMPARAHRYYLEEFYIRDAFAKGELVVGDTPITLGDIKGPVYHVATKEDHIAPAASVYRGAKQMTKADVRFVLSGSGHIAGVVNPPVLQKYQYWTNSDLSPATIEDWLTEAVEIPGSWWPDWDAWLKERSGKLVPARVPGAKLGAIEPAPGSYVKVRFDAPPRAGPSPQPEHRRNGQRRGGAPAGGEDPPDVAQQPSAVVAVDPFLEPRIPGVASLLAHAAAEAVDVVAHHPGEHQHQHRDEKEGPQAEQESRQLPGRRSGPREADERIGPGVHREEMDRSGGSCRSRRARNLPVVRVLLRWVVVFHLPGRQRRPIRCRHRPGSGRRAPWPAP